MKINLNQNETKSITLLNQNVVDLTLKNNSNLELILFYFDDLKKVSLKGEILESAKLKLVVGDFSKSSIEIIGNILLKEDNSKADLLVRSISEGKAYKNIDISLIQSAKNTYGYSDSFGISKGSSTLKFCGVDEILKGASGAFASLNYKVVIFDPLANGISNPILKIAEEDVKASHGAIVGRLNEDELFYLNSRGLTELESKKLIANGYFSKLLQFGDEDIKKKIENSIKEAFDA